MVAKLEHPFGIRPYSLRLGVRKHAEPEPFISAETGTSENYPVTQKGSPDTVSIYQVQMSIGNLTSEPHAFITGFALM